MVKNRKMLTLICLILVYIVAVKSLNPKQELESSIEINAADEIIWDIVSNFNAYPDWNTYVVFRDKLIEKALEECRKREAEGGWGSKSRWETIRKAT